MESPLLIRHALLQLDVAPQVTLPLVVPDDGHAAVPVLARLPAPRVRQVLRGVGLRLDAHSSLAVVAVSALVLPPAWNTEEALSLS